MAKQVQTDPNSPAFDSADDAARAIGAAFNDKSGEQAAIIVRGLDGKFRYSTFVAGSDHNFDMRIGLQQGEALAAIMHSHPGSDGDGLVFSPQDLEVADQLKVPSYVKFSGQKGAIRSYTTGKTKTRAIQSPGYRVGTVRVADGDGLSSPPAPSIVTPTAPIAGTSATAAPTVQPPQAAPAPPITRAINGIAGLLAQAAALPAGSPA